jgi:hypothetical protein
MRKASAFATAAVLALCACSQSPAEQNATALEDAAEQSDPAAAGVLENAADAAREGANVNVQDAMQAAGNAQSAAGNAAAAPPSQGAKPHAPGDPVPPPQIKAGEQADGNQAGH